MENKFQSPLAAYVAPFAVFMGGLALVAAVGAVGKDGIFFARPEFWVYPLQTLLCGGVLVFYWRRYDFGAAGGYPLAVMAGFLALALWLLPQVLLGFPPRTEGFDPTVFSGDPLLYRLTVVARFARLVVVVPLVEEIFWRGFLMRYLIREDFETVALGTYRSLSFFGVAGMFMLVHATPDWPAAFLTGLIYNGLMVKTKSLAACVAAHAITNLGLGLYIMATGQWGFW
jgi:CAAX prenyl protease-like protein